MNKRDIFILSIMIFLTIVAWVMFEIYQLQLARNTKNVKVAEEVQVPKERIDTSVLNKLLKKTK